MLNNIEGAKEFYKFTAAQLPQGVVVRGSGEIIEPLSENIIVQMSEDRMVQASGDIEVQVLDLGCEKYDAAVSVESLHHFTSEQKLGLYRKLWCALKEEGYFVLTDYFAESEELEKEYFETLQRLKLEQGIADDAFYHYDTPLTVEHEVDVLKAAGFAEVKILKNWGATFTVVARR